MGKLYVIFLWFLIYAVQVKAYNKTTDSLLNELKKQNPDSIQIEILIKLSAETQFSHDSTFRFAKSASETAEKFKSNYLITRSEIALGKWYLNNSKVSIPQ